MLNHLNVYLVKTLNIMEFGNKTPAKNSNIKVAGLNK